MCQNVLIKAIIINYFCLYFLKEIAHLRRKIEQAGYEIIHTYNVTLLRGKMYSYVRDGMCNSLPSHHLL